MLWLYLILLTLHILICIVLSALIFTKTIKVSKYMLFIVLLLPVWGAAAVVFLHFQTKLDREGTKEIQLEKMKLDSEVYRSITVEEKKNANILVPMEEALIVNSPMERRELIMDVLNDNPSDYIRFLQSAGDNDDTEVVHYAVTAMVEISKENDYSLQQFEKKYSNNPDDIQLVSEYCDFLWNCLEQNLMQGQVEKMNRLFVNELFAKKLKADTQVQDYVNYAKNNMKLENWTLAKEIIDRMEKMHPDCEQLILLKLDYYAGIGKGQKIKDLIEDVESKRIYL